MGKTLCGICTLTEHLGSAGPCADQERHGSWFEKAQNLIMLETTISLLMPLTNICWCTCYGQNTVWNLYINWSLYSRRGIVNNKLGVRVVGQQVPVTRELLRHLRQLNIELPCDPAIPLLGIYLDKTFIQKLHAPLCS